MQLLRRTSSLFCVPSAPLSPRASTTARSTSARRSKSFTARNPRLPRSKTTSILETHFELLPSTRTTALLPDIPAGHSRAPKTGFQAASLHTGVAAPEVPTSHSTAQKARIQAGFLHTPLVAQGCMENAAPEGQACKVRIDGTRVQGFLLMHNKGCTEAPGKGGPCSPCRGSS